MKKEKIARQIDRARKDLEAIMTNLSEAKALRDIPFQVAKVGEVKKDLDLMITQIQGSGTGNE